MTLEDYERGHVTYCGLLVQYERIGQRVRYWEGEYPQDFREMDWTEFLSKCEPTK